MLKFVDQSLDRTKPAPTNGGRGDLSTIVNWWSAAAAAGGLSEHCFGHGATRYSRPSNCCWAAAGLEMRIKSHAIKNIIPSKKNNTTMAWGLGPVLPTLFPLITIIIIWLWARVTNAQQMVYRIL
jgi:hypothetical protein